MQMLVAIGVYGVQAPPPTTQTSISIAPTTQGRVGLRITLADAIERARRTSVEYRAALVELGIRHEDRVIARSSLLPNANYRSEFLYTQPTGGSAQARQDVLGGTPIFVANNAVHEYIGQGNVHQDLSGALFLDYSRSRALEAIARAKAEIASRGLIVTVVSTYYSYAVAQRKLTTTERALDEANRFLAVSQKLQHGGEVAQSDVLKAQLQANDRRRDMQEAQLAIQLTKVQLAALLFKDFNLDFTIADDLDAVRPIAPREEVVAAAQSKNPDLSAAAQALKAAKLEVASAKADYLPSLGLDYVYGLDATHVALRSNGTSNLGYSAGAQLNIPIWNWFATNAKIRQATLTRDQAQLELSAAQKKLLGELQTKYDEAVAAQQELEILRGSATLAADSLRLTTLRYEGGEATVLEVVDAQNTLTLARNALDDGALRFRVALASLQTLTGNWKP